MGHTKSLHKEVDELNDIEGSRLDRPRSHEAKASGDGRRRPAVIPDEGMPQQAAVRVVGSADNAPIWALCFVFAFDGLERNKHTIRLTRPDPLGHAAGA